MRVKRAPSWLTKSLSLQGLKINIRVTTQGVSDDRKRELLRLPLCF